jgi:hypothetical protein
LPHTSPARPFEYLPSFPSLNYSTCPFTPSFPRTPPTHLDQPHSIYGCMRIQYIVMLNRNGENKCILKGRHRIMKLRQLIVCEVRVMCFQLVVSSILQHDITAQSRIELLILMCSSIRDVF